MKLSKILLLCAIPSIIILMLLGGFWLKNSADTAKLPTNSESSSTSETEANDNSQSDVNVDEKTKQSAVSFVQDLLTKASKDPNDRTLEQRLGIGTETAPDGKDIISEETYEMLHFADFFKAPEMQTMSIQSLVSLAELVSTQSQGLIAAADVPLDEMVYLDTEQNEAFVPIDLFLSRTTGFSFHIIWIDEQWKFAPYSFLEAVQLADMLTYEEPEA